MDSKKGIITAGAILGFLAAFLVFKGNPGNMGFCIACFLRDTAGAVGLHSAVKLHFIRPEVIGIVLGAFITAIMNKEFNTKGGSSPFTRFCLGFFVMIGSLAFLGCPLRMILRLGGGDLNAIVGLIGFTCGIYLGIIFLNKGFSLKRNYSLNKAEGYLLPIICVMLFILLLKKPDFISLKANHAPIYLTLLVGLLVGYLAQKTRLCMAGGIRDLIMFKDNYLLSGFISVFVFSLIGNVIFGNFKFGFTGQPIAHNDGLWNFLGMVLAGWGSVLLGGCPMRQLILSGEGNIDSVITVLGMFVGAAFCHNFKLAASPEGIGPNGKIAVILGLIVVLFVSYLNMDKSFDVKMKGDANIEAN